MQNEGEKTKAKTLHARDLTKNPITSFIRGGRYGTAIQGPESEPPKVETTLGTGTWDMLLLSFFFLSESTTTETQTGDDRNDRRRSRRE